MVVLSVFSVTWQAYVAWRGLQMVGKGRCRPVRQERLKHKKNCKLTVIDYHLLPLVAPEVVVMASCGASRDDKVGIY